MALSCRHQGHLPHIWPSLPLDKNHMIYSCEQYCQWCPGAAKDLKRWVTATNLRAGKGGRQYLVLQNALVDTKVLYQRRLQEATSNATVSGQFPTSELVPTESAVSNSSPFSLPDQVATSEQPIVDSNPVPNPDPSSLPLDGLSTSQTVEPSTGSSILGSVQLPTPHVSRSKKTTSRQLVPARRARTSIHRSKRVK
ncbi:hypothetical protein BGZ60DRAFT_142394 [Tricladium varicosporioides]|nr:hypothetical protein BGZ60DRAFT_142394 [Hymenoscyphus varicosporioides]